MARHRHRYVRLTSALGAALALMLLITPAVQGADQFAGTEFGQQWNRVEMVVPNFWGPLGTARNGQVEPYAEGVYRGEPGVRLVQYFDKARMEKTNLDRPVTNGLLTVELKTGKLQLGDFSFQPRNPANIEIAGDQDAPGPTYATLGDLPEKVGPQPGGAVGLGYDSAGRKYVRVQPATDPELRFVTYQSDPGGRFGQDIPRAFWDFMQRIPGGWLTTMGYPIGEAFGAQVRVNGRDTFLVVQAFERRVLTYTPSNAAGFRVEFGNIGRHYDRWRYERSRPVGAPPHDNLIGTSVTSGAFTAIVTDATWTGMLGSDQLSGAFVVVFVDVTRGGTPDPGGFSIMDARGNRLTPGGADVQNAAQQQYSAGGFGDALEPGTKAVFVFTTPAVVRLAPAPAPLPAPMPVPR